MELVSDLSRIEVDLINQSVKAVLPRKREFRRSFYTRLIDLDPNAGPLFRKTFLDIDALPDSILMMSEFASNPGKHIKEIKSSGLKHKTYGVKTSQFKLIRSVAVDTFEEFLGDEFNNQMKSSWLKLIDFFIEYMKLGWKRK